MDKCDDYANTVRFDNLFMFYSNLVEGNLENTPITNLFAFMLRLLSTAIQHLYDFYIFFINICSQLWFILHFYVKTSFLSDSAMSY